MSPPWTIGRLLQWTTGYLTERGADAPRLDAELLLAEARGCQRIDLYTAFGDEPAEPVRVAFRELVRRRAEGTPVAYLLGRREFFSLDFRVTTDVLIPRPETELLVTGLIDLAKATASDGGSGSLRIADVGTGSGIIAVCAARFLPQARVTAIDISPAALEVALSNALKHEVAERIEWLEGDLLEPVEAAPAFDFILSNPPYVSEQELATLAPEVRDHEPRGALVAGSAGTEVIQRLLPQAAERLLPGGHLLVEISPMLAEEARGLVAAEERFELVELVRDAAGHQRVMHARRKT